MVKQVSVSVGERCEAVLKLLRREGPAAQIARRLGVSERTLYRWRDDFLAGVLRPNMGGDDRQQARQQEPSNQVFRVPILVDVYIPRGSTSLPRSGGPRRIFRSFRP